MAKPPSWPEKRIKVPANLCGGLRKKSRKSKKYRLPLHPKDEGFYFKIHLTRADVLIK